MSIIDKDIENLRNYESFARVLQEIYFMREDSIGDLASPSTESAMHTAGYISALDKILKTCGWEEVRKRHAESLL